MERARAQVARALTPRAASPLALIPPIARSQVAEPTPLLLLLLLVRSQPLSGPSPFAASVALPGLQRPLF